MYAERIHQNQSINDRVDQKSTNQVFWGKFRKRIMSAMIFFLNYDHTWPKIIKKHELIAYGAFGLIQFFALSVLVKST